MTEETGLIVTDEFKEKIKAFKKDFYNKYKKISKEKTPQVDGTGKKIIDKKGNYDYIIAAYMVECLDRHFPGWSWEIAAPLQFLGAEWVVAEGTLTIIDEHLLAFGISPPYRKFYGCNAARITYPTGQQHLVGNIIDVGNNVKAANTEAMKVAINRLTHIGDDVYRKRIEEEGAGSMEDIITGATVSSTDSQAKMFNEFLAKHKIPVSKTLSILGIKSLASITDYKQAYDTITKELGL